MRRWYVWICIIIIILFLVVCSKKLSSFKKDNLIIFLTHNFRPEFKGLLSRTRTNQSTDVVILFDESSTQWEDTDFNVIREKKWTIYHTTI